MKIIIETIAHETQRYPTVGDWYYEGETLHVKVSDLGNERMNQLVAVHELIEVLLCQHAGISQAAVDEFDIAFEKNREDRMFEASKSVSEPGVTCAEEQMISIEEPGDDISAPYRKQHCFATAVERMMAAEMDVPWNDYASKIESMP